MMMIFQDSSQLHENRVTSLLTKKNPLESLGALFFLSFLQAIIQILILNTPREDCFATISCICHSEKSIDSLTFYSMKFTLLFYT